MTCSLAPDTYASPSGVSRIVIWFCDSDELTSKSFISSPQISKNITSKQMWRLSVCAQVMACAVCVLHTTPFDTHTCNMKFDICSRRLNCTNFVEHRLHTLGMYVVCMCVVLFYPHGSLHFRTHLRYPRESSFNQLPGKSFLDHHRQQEV